MEATFLKTVLHYDPLTGVFTRLKPWGSKLVGSPIGGLSPAGYWQISVNKKTYPAQRLAWAYVYGEWPQGSIDHINQIKTDNRIENLRVINYSLNAHNTPLRSTNNTGVKGVSLRSLRNGRRPNKAWVASIMVNGKRKHLGTFFTLEEAANARANAEKEMGAR
jgi:hypothetical protein